MPARHGSNRYIGGVSQFHLVGMAGRYEEFQRIMLPVDSKNAASAKRPPRNDLTNAPTQQHRAHDETSLEGPPQDSNHHSPTGSLHGSVHYSPTGSVHSAHSSHNSPKIEMPKEKAKKHYDAARLFYTDGGGTSIELERVIKELSVSSSYAPKDARYFFFLAKVFKQSLDFASAIYTLRYVLKLDEHHAAARKHLAELLMKHGQEKMCDAVLAQQRGQEEQQYSLLYNTARVFFDECLVLNKMNAKVWMFKSVCHVHLRQQQDAIDALSRGIHISTGDVRCHVPWTDKRFENDSKGLSGKEVHRLVLARDADRERQERNVRILCEMHVLRGKLYWAGGLTEQGNKDLRFASTLLPEHPEVLVFGALSHKKAERLYAMCVEAYAAGRLGEAGKHIRLALNLSPDDIKMHIMNSKLCRAAKDLSGSYSAIQRATELYQSSSSFDMRLPEDILQQTNLIYNDMAIQCAAQGEYEKSIALLNKVIISERKLTRGLTDINFRFFVNRGDCYRACHELQQAKADYQLALQLIRDPEDQWVVKTRLSLTYYLLATDFFNTSEFALADAAASKAIQSNPQVAAYYAARGQARYYLGRYQEAHDDYRRCLELDPSNDEARLRLAQQYEQTKSLDAGPAAQAGAAVSSAGYIDVRRSVVESMASLQVRPEHQVQAMLHPREARGLPDIRKIVKASSAVAALTGGLSGGGSGCPTLAPRPLPLVNPRLTTSWMAAQDASTCKEKVQLILAKRADVGKGAMWSTLDNAKYMAQARCRPAGALSIEARASKEAGKDGDKGKSYTSAGLKRFSQEASRAALAKYKDDFSFIAGVITSYDDPFLNSLEQPGQRKQNLHIRIAAAGIHEGRRKKLEEDEGSCTIYDHEDSPTGEAFERAEWLKLRSSGPAVADDLIHHLTHAPPTPPAAAEADGGAEARSLASLSTSAATTARQRPEFERSSKTASKFGSRTIGSRYSGGGGAAGGRGGGGRGGRGLGLRVRFASASDGGVGGGETQDGGSVDGSRIVELLAEHGILEENHTLQLQHSGDAFGIVFSEESESALLSMTEEEELAVAAELRAKAEKAESRRKRDLRRDQMRSKIMGERGNV